MLAHLSIRDVVLIDRLDLAFEGGLCVLTGETGAGKSILLDALGLALGLRAEQRLVRGGAEQASVAATFDVGPAHGSRAIAAEQGIAVDPGEPVILRRVLRGDGRSRAYVNDQPASVGLLKQIGETLVEVHGQFDSQRLLESSRHRDLLDAFAGVDGRLAETRAAWEAWRACERERAEAAAALEEARRDEEALRHAVDELEALAPQAGEEARLADTRKTLMHVEKIADALTEAQQHLTEGDDVESRIGGALGALERVREHAGSRLDETIGALERALGEMADAAAHLDKVSADLDMDPGELERAEERLFALRALARKHQVEVDRLPEKLASFRARLAALEDGGSDLDRLAKAAAAARAAYADAAQALHAARTEAAGRMDAAVARELEPLKLGGATFATAVEVQEEDDWGAAGWDRVRFQVATNPGAPLGPLNKIASGGELARFMLALKVVLAEADPVPSLVFDEVDAGIGGAVADAVGERLGALGCGVQVLVVTHSPQVAARGVHHFRVRKQVAGKATTTTVDTLIDDERTEEVARMLAGAKVTTEARAAAQRLIDGGGV